MSETKSRGKRVTEEKTASLFGGLKKSEVNRPISSDGGSSDLVEIKAEVRELEAQLKDALVPQPDGSWLLFNTVRLTRTGIDVPQNFNENDWELLGDFVTKFNKDSQWWVGEWANHYIDPSMDDFEKGRIYREIATKRNREPRTIADYALVCLRIDPSLRKEGLRYSHHREVAFMPKSLHGQEEYYLNMALEKELSVRDLREIIGKDAEKLDPEKYKSDIIFDVKPLKKQFAQVTSLYAIDPKSLKDKKRDEYRGKIAALRRVLDELEDKLDS